MVTVANAFDKALKLINEGYAKYSGEVDQSVYDNLRCRKEKQARWFIRVTPRRRILYCVGCTKECILTNPTGFQAVIPIEAKYMTRVAIGTVPLISDEELLATKKTLTIPEVMSVCRVEERKVRSLIDNGDLMATKDTPVRVHSSSVKEYLERTR